MSSRDLNLVIPQMKCFALKLIGRAQEELGIKVIVTCTARTYQEQIALYAQGRQPLSEVNILRQIAKLPSINSKENSNKVTWTMASKHIINLLDNDKNNDLCKAIDFGILDKNGKYQGDIKADVNNDNKYDYIQLGELGNKIAKELNFSILWGGDFKKSKDYPHYEWVGDI